MNHLEQLKTWTYESLWRVKDRDKAAKAYLNQFDKTIAPFKDRIIMNKEFVQMIQINHSVVNKRLSKMCSYINGNYIGNVYIDRHGNVFGNVSEVRNKYGDSFILCPRECYQEYYSECVYVPELKSILVATITCCFRGSINNIDENNSHLDYFYISAPLYRIITHDFMTINKSTTCTELNSCYIGEQNVKIPSLMAESKKLLNLPVGIVNVGGNKYVPLDTISNLIIYSNYKAKLAYKSGKIQNKIDELLAEKEFDSTPLPDRMPHEYHNLVSKTHINKINDNLCVVRWSYSYQNEGFDGMRVYIDGTDVYACKRNNQGQFIRVALSTLNQKNFTAEYNSEIEIDDMTGTRLEWYSSVINKLPEKYRMTLLMLFLTDVKIEQLVKLGFGPTICQKMDATTNNIGATIRSVLKVNADAETGKNIYRWIGLNKHQLDACANLCIKNSPNNDKEDLLNVIADIKEMFSNDDLSSYNDDLFDNMLDAYDHIINNTAGYWTKIHPANIGGLLHRASENDDTGIMKSNMLKNLPKILAMCNWQCASFNYFIDYINMVLRMGIKKDVRLYPNSFEDLVVMHDNTSAVYNMHRDQYRRSEFMKRVPDWEKFEYENEDFDFCVVSPKKPEDIAVEGIMLHHCVKSYIERVAHGNTNILFVRKKDDANTPFFTVELTNDRVIAQVHGFANRNADTEAGMIEFINRWARNKRLKVGAINSVRG